MMLVQTERKLFSVVDYHKIIDVGILTAEDDVELLNGEIVYMSPIKSPHASIVDILAEELIYTLAKSAIIRGQNPITLHPYSEPEPDITVVKKKQIATETGIQMQQKYCY